LTIEDPIEYKLDNIGQMAVKPKIGLTFAQGLRHILRQDPDVILVGETRDLETAEIAVRSSLTGHLVFSTLHTNDALGAVIRLVDMGIPAYLVAAATRAVVAQRLVRTLCPHCKTPAVLQEEDRVLLAEHQRTLPEDGTLFAAKGCDRCFEGYKGRTGIYELLMITDELRSLIRQSADAEALRACQARSGSPLLIDHALQKVRDGETDMKEVLRVTGRT